jgi:multiple sugar transport system permease protein
MADRHVTPPQAQRSIAQAVASRLSVQLRGAKVLGRVVLYVVLVVVAGVFLLPFVWMISGAFKDPSQILTIPPVWIPHPPTLKNYQQAFSLVPVPRYYLNSAIIAVVATLGTLFSSCVVGYAFARLPAKGKNVWFVIALSTMMVPFQVTLFPQYALYFKLGWVNTYLPLMVPPFLGVGGALFIFLMRQFFLSIPNELEEAAVIDGCSTIGVFWRIMLPLSRTAMVTVVIFQFVFTWNDFFGPLIYLTNSNMFTLPLGIATFQSAYGTEVGPLLALSLLAIIPILILFFIGQKTFVQGIATTGLKG